MKYLLVPLLCVIIFNLSAQGYRTPDYYHWNQFPALINPAYVGVDKVARAYTVFSLHTKYLKTSNSYYGVALFGELPLDVKALSIGSGYRLGNAMNRFDMHQVNFAVSYLYELNDNHAFSVGGFLGFNTQNTLSGATFYKTGSGEKIEADNSYFDIDLGIIYAFKTYAELGFSYSGIINDLSVGLDGEFCSCFYNVRQSYMTFTARGKIVLENFKITPYGLTRGLSLNQTAPWGWNIGVQVSYQDKYQFGGGALQGDQFYVTAGKTFGRFLSMGYGMGFQTGYLSHELVLSIRFRKSTTEKRLEHEVLKEEEQQRYFNAQRSLQEQKDKESSMNKMNNSRIEALEKRVKVLEDSLQVYKQVLQRFNDYATKVIREETFNLDTTQREGVAYLVAGGFSTLRAARKWQEVLRRKYKLPSERIDAKGMVYVYIFKSKYSDIVRNYLMNLPQKAALEEELKSNLWVYIDQK